MLVESLLGSDGKNRHRYPMAAKSQLFGPPDRISVGFYRAAVTDLSPGLSALGQAANELALKAERAAESKSVVAPPLVILANGRLSGWLARKADRRFNAVHIGRPFSFQGELAGEPTQG